MNGYELTTRWFAFCDEHPEWVDPTVTALFFAIIQCSNELRWKRKFHLPTLDTMQRIGIRSPKTYYPALEKLERAGFIRVLERAKNQYTACIIEVLQLNGTEPDLDIHPATTPADAAELARSASVNFTSAPSEAMVSPSELLTNAPVKITEALAEPHTPAQAEQASARVENTEAHAEAQETYINKKTIQTKNIYAGANPNETESTDPDSQMLETTVPRPPNPERREPVGSVPIPAQPIDPSEPATTRHPPPPDTRVRTNGNGQMIKPDLQTLTAFMLAQGGTAAMGETMFDFYTSKGWLVGKSPMKDWNAAARKWIRENGSHAPPGNQRAGPPPNKPTSAPRPTHQTNIR